MKLAALFSGGKDSSYSLYLSMNAGHEVAYLVTAYAPQASYMYHVPAIELSQIASQAMGIPQIQFTVSLDDELTPLEKVLSRLEIEGVCAGAVASEYQRSRIARICQNLGLELVAPLWGRNPEELLFEMVEEGFKIMIVGVAAMGLDEYWLGQVLGPANLDRFLELCRKYRIHPGREGGEYESFVLGGPHMRGIIDLTFRKRWHGDSGELEILHAELLP